MSFLSNLFGGGGSTQVTPSQINYTPSGFSSSGLNASVSGGGVNLTQSPGLSSAIGNLSSTFGNEANAFGGLLNTVRPGFSQLRRAGLNQINTQQQATTSNLRDTLAQRRVLGSSFANASLSQNDAEFAQQKANFVAQSYLSELSASQQLIQSQFTAAAQSYSTQISQMNFDTQIASQLTGQVNSALANIATAQAQLDQQAAQFNAKQNADSQAGLGKLFGTLLTAPMTGGGSLFGSLASGFGNALSFGASALSGGGLNLANT